MSLLLKRIMLGLGIIGHALNMYCDRILCIFPNGTINFSNIKEITEGDAAAKLMESTSEKLPMRSAVYVIVVVTGVIGFPIWALIFTILPIVIVMFPFRIIGTLHIAAMVSMLGWMLLL